MLTKPSTKTVTSAAFTAGALVLGAKVGDGVSALMPASANSYKKMAIGAVAIIAAACISPKTTVSTAVQNGLIGMGTKQLYDELTDTLAEAIPVKVSSDATVSLGVTDRFLNAVVGHKEVPLASLGQSWIGDNSDMWSRPEASAQPQLSFTGV